MQSDRNVVLERAFSRFDSWNIIHVSDRSHRRVSQTRYVPYPQRLLPVLPEDVTTNFSERWPTRTLPMVTLPPHSFWSSIAREYVYCSLYRASAESLASENAARITAMQSAEKHIGERLRELHQDDQQLRQDSITEELLDVINGYEALQSPR